MSSLRNRKGRVGRCSRAETWGTFKSPQGRQEKGIRVEKARSGWRRRRKPELPSAAKLGGVFWQKGASLVAQMVRNLPAGQETRVQFLDWEDPLEKRMAAHSGILAWRIPWTEEEPGRPQSTSLQRVGHDQVTFGRRWSMMTMIQEGC